MLNKIKKAMRKLLRFNKNKKHATSFKYCKRNLRVGKGLEIGGPSKFFSEKGRFPIYPILAPLDNCDYSEKTVWNENLSNDEKTQYIPYIKYRRNIIAEAINLGGIEDGHYDFVISSHAIEHIANPILALKEWCRVTRDDGHLVLVIPDKEKTFDHRRPVTSMTHLIEDYKKKMGEDDRTHFDEILELHDFDGDPDAGSVENFKERLLLNSQYRCAHHHVFDLSLAKNLVEYCGYKVVAAERYPFCHLVIVGVKEISR